MTTLVTGASGGLGRVLSRKLRARPDASVILSSRAPRNPDDCIPCDVTDRAAVRALVGHVRPKLVYHLAGSFANCYDTDYAVNTLAARHLLEAILEEGLAARVVLIGSAAEYGPIKPGENPVGEDHVLRPVSVYGLTKAFQTQMAGWYAQQRGADVVVARMFNLLAPGLSERLFVGRVERLVARYRAGEIDRIDVGTLDNQRDYIAAEAAASLIERIAERGLRGHVYHVGSGRPLAMRDLLRQLLDAAGVPMDAVREGTTSGGRVGYDAPVIYADMRRTDALEKLEHATE